MDCAIIRVAQDKEHPHALIVPIFASIHHALTTLRRVIGVLMEVLMELGVLMVHVIILNVSMVVHVWMMCAETVVKDHNIATLTLVLMKPV